MPPSAPIDLARLTAALQGCTVGHSVEAYGTVASTMQPAHAWIARTGFRSGSLVVADEQSAGRGRLNRRWEAPPGSSLLVSVALTGDHIALGPLLPLAAGLAALEAMDAVTGAPERYGLKWPNDIVAGSPGAGQRKLGGILVEAVHEGGTLRHAVLGVGINVSQQADELPQVEPPALPPTSLALEEGPAPAAVDRTRLLDALCRSLDRCLALPGPELLARWQRRLWTLGRTVTLHAAGGSTRTARAVAVTPSGGLLLEDETGTFSVDAGDVSLR